MSVKMVVSEQELNEMVTVELHRGKIVTYLREQEDAFRLFAVSAYEVNDIERGDEYYQAAKIYRTAADIVASSSQWLVNLIWQGEIEYASQILDFVS